MTNPKFQIYKGENGKFYFRLSARNGQNILSSQGYAGKSGCKGGIDSVRKNAQNPDAFEKKIAKNGKHYFNLLAVNKQIIGSSQMYATTKSMQGGIEAIQRVAQEAQVEDTAV